MTDFFKFRSNLEEAAKVKQAKKPSEVYEDEDGPCWKGYVQVGTKMKDGKEVPNCVPEGTQVDEARRKKTGSVIDDIESTIDSKMKDVEKDLSPRARKKIQTAQDEYLSALRDLEDFANRKKNENTELSEAAYYDYPDYGPVGASEMAQTQLHFIKYAADDVTRCLKSGCPMPEWYQNKLAKIEGDMEGLYSYMKGKTRKMKAHQADRYSMGMSMYGEETLTESKTVEVSPSHARKANDIAKDMFRGEYDTDGSNSFVFKKADTADDFRAELEKQKVELNESYMDKFHFITKKERGKTVYLQYSGSLRVGETGPKWIEDPESANAYLDKKEAEKLAKRYGGKVQKGINEQAKSGGGEAYDKFFRAALRKFGVEDPGDLSKEKKKEFFNYVDKNWKADDEDKVDEEAQSGDKEAYTKFFNKALKKFGVDSPAELKGDKEKEFYDYVDKNWKSDKELKKESYISEKLKPSDDVSKWIEDFYDSDAPQFKGKDKEERREMAVAAWLEARREAGYDVDPNPNE